MANSPTSTALLPAAQLSPGAVASAARPAPAALPAILALAWRELVRFFRQRNRVIGALGQPIIFWLLFSEGLKSNNLDYGHFFPGTLAMILLFTAIFATISVIEDRNEGFLQGVLVSPTPRWAMVLGKVLGGAAIAWLQAMFFLLLGCIGFWSVVHPPAWDALQALVMMALMAVALTGLGFAIAWRMESTHAFHAIMSVFLLPMWLLSGAFFRHGEDGVLGWVVAVNPLTYGVAGLRRYTVHADGIASFASDKIAGLPPLWVCWLVTFAFAAAMLALSWRVAGTRTRADQR